VRGGFGGGRLKWLGTAFARLPLGDLADHLTGALAESTWPAREGHLIAAYRTVALSHYELGLTEPLSPDTHRSRGRPAQVLGGSRFARALMADVDDPAISGLPLTGTVDQIVDNADAVGDPELRRRATAHSA
jgi:hypothetical protein